MCEAAHAQLGRTKSATGDHSDRNGARNSGMVPHPRPPAAIRPHADADARAPDDRAHADAPVFNVEAIPDEIAPILRQPNPHRHRQIAWTPAQLVLRQRRRLCGRRRPFIARPRRRRMTSMPSSGSSARMSTAAGTPSASVTTFTREWMP